MTTAIESLGVGLGFRRELAAKILQDLPASIDWLEIHPENYIDRGGPLVRDFEIVRAHYPIRPHGLTQAVGNTTPLNWTYLKKLKQFLREYNMTWYSDHLCFSAHGGFFLHDLLPIPFTMQTVKHVSERARILQDFLEVPFGIENTSYYVHVVKPEMTELEFVSEILDRSGVYLMCDVNNLYVNQLNHGANALEFVQKIDVQRILQIHVAGHDASDAELVIDTHSHPVCDNVWQLLTALGERAPLASILIERDGNFPEFSELLWEVATARRIYEASHARFAARAAVAI